MQDDGKRRNQENFATQRTVTFGRSCDRASIAGSVEAEVDIQKDWQIFQGHFPEQPILPGIYIMESMAQTADILLLLSEQNRGKLPLFFQVSQMRFYHPVYPGVRLYLSAQLTSDSRKMACMTAE